MSFSFKGFFYSTLIDPLVKPIRGTILSMINPGQKVIEIACGTGALAAAIAQKADHITGIDISEDMIVTAKRNAARKKINNIKFDILDASDLSGYPDKSFDIAVTSLSMHQFDTDTAIKVLSEMKRLAATIIIADYNCPMDNEPARTLAFSVERLAGGEHYRNFRSYMKYGGIRYLAEETGLNVKVIKLRGKGIFAIGKLI